MARKIFIDPHAILSRRRMIASALMYGLSLTVRFTSAAGEEVEIPAQFPQRKHPVISIMAGNGVQLPYHDWGPKSAQPIIFRHGWSPSSVTPGCTSP
jgi:hypothetical protein